jgi:predicted DNA-binding protein (MmcQ/YjbR family)
MTIEDLRSICKSLKSVTEDIKWEDHLCFNIGGKMFLITSTGPAPQPASFKVSDEDFGLLTEKQGFIPAPYLARYKWVQVDDISRLSKKQWKDYAEKSYRLIGSKLPAKVKKEISWREE